MTILLSDTQIRLNFKTAFYCPVTACLRERERERERGGRERERGRGKRRSNKKRGTKKEQRRIDMSMSEEEIL
jgi:hypothetical protein